MSGSLNAGSESRQMRSLKYDFQESTHPCKLQRLSVYIEKKTMLTGNPQDDVPWWWKSMHVSS